MATATAIEIEAPPQGILVGERTLGEVKEAPAEAGQLGGAKEAPAEAGQTLSEGELRAWRGLKRAHASLAKRVDAELERTHGLPLSTYEVLHHLAESPGGRMRMCDLAEHAQLSRSGLTRLADRLEKDGLLERCSCEHDARGAYACLTELGRERLCAARGTHLAVVREQFFSRFSEAELSALAELWERIAPCGGCRSAES
ncbi:MAG TPA: MarR family transcriptional regulator [Solirubrobacteraceae bacterium]|nr:MarR family transcriptional regulator [Solirubrobacteraceae bacterium]